MRFFLALFAIAFIINAYLYTSALMGNENARTFYCAISSAKDMPGFCVTDAIKEFKK